MSVTNHSKRALKIMFHRIGIYMLRNRIFAEEEENGRTLKKFFLHLFVLKQYSWHHASRITVVNHAFLIFICLGLAQ